jgi:hypothetical protein
MSFDFKNRIIFNGDGSNISYDLMYADHYEELDESKSYVSGTYDFGKGEKEYYWDIVSYVHFGKVKQFAIAKQLYSFLDVQKIKHLCQCNYCNRSIVSKLHGLYCICCKGCLKMGFESEYDIPEHVMKRTLIMYEAHTNRSID